MCYSWHKDGMPVRQGEGLRVAANGRRLIVSRAQVSDTARFQCVATNEAGNRERSFSVVVHGNMFFCSLVVFINIIYSTLVPSLEKEITIYFQFLLPSVPLGLLNVQWFSTSPLVWNVCPAASLLPASLGLKMVGLST